MSFKLAYSTLRWREPDLEPALVALKEAGWDGWEARLDLNWLGTPQRVKQICDNADMPMVVYTASGRPEDSDAATFARNQRRMEFAAEMGCDCFMYMSGRKPEGRAVTDDDIKAAAAAAEEWAEFAEPLGLELSYHIHTNLLVDNIEDWKLYMSQLDKAKLCIDVSHAELWGYDPAQSLRDFADQLNYVHLQDYASCTVKEEGKYNPVWVAVGEAECLDFVEVKETLEEMNFDRWVTGCPGEPVPGYEDAVSESQYSAKMYQYLRGLGY